MKSKDKLHTKGCVDIQNHKSLVLCLQFFLIQRISCPKQTQLHFTSPAKPTINHFFLTPTRNHFPNLPLTSTQASLFLFLLSGWPTGLLNPCDCITFLLLLSSTALSSLISAPSCIPLYCTATSFYCIKSVTTNYFQDRPCPYLHLPIIPCSKQAICICPFFCQVSGGMLGSGVLTYSS